MSATPSSSKLAQALRAAADHHRAGRLEHAERAYAAILAESPGNADALHLSGVVALQRGDATRAESLITAALTRSPRFAEAAVNLGHALRALGRTAAAEAVWSKALTLQPGNLAALLARASARRDLGDFAGAAQDAEAAAGRAPAGTVPVSQPAVDRARICDWSRRTADLAAVAAEIRTGGPVPSPLVVLALGDEPGLQRQMAEVLAPAAAPAALPSFPPPAPDRLLRIGVFSGECGDTAVWRLALEAIEHLGRLGFELIGFGWGPPRPGPMRARAEAAFARFHDCTGLDDPAIVGLARSEGLDIALDLAGYTRWARPGLFAARLAPVQVNWLAWPGTLGSAVHEYLLADATTVPAGAEPAFSEAVVRLPCYQPNLREVAIAAGPTRAQAGLPERGLVFACFNQPYKIAPGIFRLWMGLLRAVPDSVLWLMDALPQASANLRAAAQAEGMDPARLAFAPPVPWPQHLARHALADLALDTFPYGGHTTTSDALRAGLPVVTMAGKSFASRVAASLLSTCGLGDLVTEDPESYAALALGLARSPERLAAARARAGQARLSPLFDSRGFARSLAAALREMHRRRCAGLPPAGFSLPEPEPKPGAGGALSAP